MSRLIRPVAVVAILYLAVVGFAGCGGETKKTTPADQASFKGGPMPPEARAKMEAAIKAANERSQQGRPKQ